MGRLGIESLTPKLPIEILRVLGGAVEMNHRRVPVAERKRGAAEPIFAERDALRTGGGAAQRQKVAQSGIRVRKEAQRNPAGQEFRLDVTVAGHQAVLGGDLIGDPRLSVVSAPRQ